MNRTVLLSVFATGLLLALSACGGGTSSKSAQTTPSAKTKSTHGAPTSTSPTKTTGIATPTAPAKVKKPGLPLSECRKLDVLAAKMGHAFIGRTPAADTKAYAEYLQRLAQTAPTDIRGDFSVLADAYRQIADAVAAVYSKPGGVADPHQLQKLTHVGREMNTAAIKDAADNVNVWLQTNCAR